MAKKFLYVIAAIIVLVIAAAIVLRVWAQELTALAMVPSAEFEAPSALAQNAYADPAMWYSHPGLATDKDPARWQPGYANDRGLLPTPAEPGPPPFAVFFVHPTSYLDRSNWNAPLDDAEANRVTGIYLRGMASPFNGAQAIWAPRYRQATFGAFLTDQTEAQQALDAAYSDVKQAFAAFVAETEPGTPIVLAGHSQGTLHLLRLLKEDIAGTPLAARVAAVYAVGWPVSIQHDLPALGLPRCSSQNQPGCIMSWSSFAEPADPSPLLETYAGSTGFDGVKRGTSPILCTNPLTGGAESAAPATLNLGTLKPDGDLSNGSLVTAAVPARCDTRGLLLIGDPPEMGRYVLPGNNYHVYDIPLFWANVQADVARRVEAWAKRP
ncbi:DUF3089 domain-containing protein [Altererythrobacter sp. BO-6]|uniref:DUF3089 domain-containing protein n=1 Tax=Altererythrobacter sp. BO-6 TaxID=2604537 RepID=UPI0013E1C721|nr:DUF3089 domain-containing protein [Altererythrobacter sp. BO-6]QIG53336.1 DUF3089 domain-containing protein [Altererythrobacter sp. BO-6]